MKNHKIKNMVILFLLLVSLLIPILIEKYIYPNMVFSVGRYFIFTFIFLFISCNFIFDYRKIWSFIYKFRYLVACLLFTFLVINGYHGSSIGMYNEIIQPSYSIQEGLPIIGKYQFIRSDEYAVDTPNILSQVNYNSLKKNTSYLMASHFNVEVYPSLPTKGLGSITNPRYIGFLFLPTDMAYSFFWYLPLFVSFMALFEFCMLITKQNKLISLLGTVLICFSPALLWWNSYIFLMYGMLSFHFFRLFLMSDSWKKKLLFCILLGWSGSCYIKILYPAWQLTYGYIYLGLFIWQLIINRKKLKWSDLWYLIPCFGIICILVIPQILNAISQINAMLNTEYPGARSILGGENWERNFLYIPSIFYPYFSIDNACEFSQIISLYPLPIIIGFIILFKNRKQKKKDLILSILMILAIFFSIFNYIRVPLLSKITFMTMVPGSRITIVLNIICVLILIIIMANYQHKTLKKEYIIPAVFISLFSVLIVTYISNEYILKHSTTPNYLTINRTLVMIGIFFIIYFFFLLNYQKYNSKYAVCLTIFNLFLGLSIYPISKGFSIIYDKPVSKEIHKIVKQDPNSIWLTVDSEFSVPNFLLANGARTINSVNYVPNYEIWEIIDPIGKYEYYYNRYAHILVSITNEETSYELLSADLLSLNLNSQKVCALNVEYLLSKANLRDRDYHELKLEEIYNDDGIYIYKTICE